MLSLGVSAVWGFLYFPTHPVPNTKQPHGMLCISTWISIWREEDNLQESIDIFTSLPNIIYSLSILEQPK